MTLRSLYLWLWLCISVSLSFSSQAVDCSTDTTGLCTPTVEEIIEEIITETTEHKPDGILITTTNDKTITTTTVENKDSGNILDGDNGFVSSSKEGDMDIDWGGQGSASMPSGSYCNNLGTDKCAEITGGGNSTSVMGVPNMGTTFINTIDISELNIKYGGETNYSIHVDKQDPQDSVYMHITGKDGTTEVFSGTDILSASGTASGFKVYENSFEFSGSLTTLIVEVGGRDIGISVGVLFDDVQINVLYNTINTIITQAITSVEMFIALNADATQDVINVVENVFESNMPIETDVGMTFEPIEIQEPTYAEVEIEIAEIEIAEIELKLETEIETSIEEPVTEETTTEKVEVEVDTKEEEQQQEEAQEEEEKETNEIEVAKNEEKEPEQIEEQEEKKEEAQEEKKEESSKEKAVKKIMKKMNDKKKYDDINQTKTLVVMQVLGNTKTFFQDQQQLNDRIGFFSNVVLPDTVINDNDMASYFLFVGSDGLMNEMIDSQWQK
jgi:hypothetical protein